jgi:hypothetical protein
MRIIGGIDLPSPFQPPALCSTDGTISKVDFSRIRVYLGSMVAQADITITKEDVKFMRMSQIIPNRVSILNLCIPIEDCHISHFTSNELCLSGSKGSDPMVFMFIHMSVKGAKNLMDALGIRITDYPRFRIDPTDPEDKYRFIVFKVPAGDPVEHIISSYPRERAHVMGRGRARQLYEQILRSHSA